MRPLRLCVENLPRKNNVGVSNMAKQRGKILDEIMKFHRENLPKIMREVPVEDLRAFASLASPAADFKAALQQPGVSLIAECKKASPSKGLLVRNYDPVQLARTYIRAGARAISVLTDGRHFQGSLGDLRDVKEATANLRALIPERGDPRLAIGVPVLRKDFIFHPYQVYESRAAGADAVLLIAAVLSDGDLKSLLQLVNQTGMQALIEVHTEEELARVLPLKPDVIGVNNRNLQTFEVDFANTGRLRAMIPDEIVVVGESGLKTAEDVQQMQAISVDAILVGETLVKSKDTYETARMLVKAGKKKA
jgi:indole-3-glycerol phosphate synthase